MVNVLYLSYDGMTDPLGQSQVIPYLEGLAQKGYRFTIISFEKKERYQKSKDQIQNLLDDANISWTPLTYHKTPPVLATLYDIYVLRKKAFALHREQSFQVVHCRSYIPALIGMVIKQKFGVKFIFDMRGFWADERVEGGLWKLSNPIYRFVYQYFKRKEKQLLQATDYTITLTHKAKDIIHEWKEIKSQPISIQVIPCCVDTELFDPKKIIVSDQQNLRKKLGMPEGAFVLSYLGSLGTWYMVEEMLIFYKVLLETKPAAIFLFLTKENPEEIWQLCHKLGVQTDSIIITPATRAKVPLYLSLSSWSIFFIKPVFSKQASSATKMGEIMSMGVPFITNSGWGDIEATVSEVESGLVVEDLTEGHFNNTIHKLTNSTYTPINLRKQAIKHYELSAGIERYCEVYRCLSAKYDKETYILEISTSAGL